MIGEPSSSQVTFSRNYKQKLQELGLTYKQVEAISGVSSSHLNSVLNGKIGLTFYTMDRLCDAVHLGAVELLQENRS
jgi:transcriptional regulator with XRE-family HTH domain